MDNEYEDLKWKAEYLQHRGYYTNMTVEDLIKMLRDSGEKPYAWKDPFMIKKDPQEPPS